MNMGSGKKYIITEDKLNQIIERYLNANFDVSEINFTSLEDEYGNPNDSAYEFYYGNYTDGEIIFRIYYEEYWIKEDDFRKDLSPILFFENDEKFSSLNTLFGDKWIPVFKKWFEDNFGFYVKTVDGYSI